MLDLDKFYNKHIQEIQPYIPVDPTEELVKSWLNVLNPI